MPGASPIHEGLDFAAPKGTPVLAAARGRVMYPTGFHVGNYGNYVRIDHGDFQTGYAHLENLAVSNGRDVEPGQVIGWVGKTGLASGYHLHFEVWVNGERQDPEEWVVL